MHSIFIYISVVSSITWAESMEHKTVRRATATFGVIWWIKILFESFSAPQSTLSTGFSSLQITIWSVWGAEHAVEGSRRVETLLPSSVFEEKMPANKVGNFNISICKKMAKFSPKWLEISNLKLWNFFETLMIHYDSKWS